jgi:hypothetical protein
MQSRTTMAPWKKISYTEDGLALHDKALTLLTPAHDTELHNGVPVPVLVRFNAASTFLAVPGFFNRGDQGARLLKEVLTYPAFDTLPLQFKGSVWMRAAKAAIENNKKPEEAKPFLERVVNAGAPQAEAAKAQLSKL